MKIGVIGINSTRHEEHFKTIYNAVNKNLHGIFSHSDDALPLSTKHNVKLYRSANELFDDVDAVYFAGSLKPNYEFALNALKKSCHLFIEDIASLSTEQVKHLYKVAFEARTKIQLKLTKAFKPEYLEVRDYIKYPKLTDISKNLTRFLRHEDYFSEILNNLFFAYQSIHSGVKKITTMGLPADNNHFSLVQIRLDYDNSSVLNIKINCIASEEESTADFHETDKLVHINFTKHFASKHKFTDGQIERREFNIPDEKAFDNEMLHFISSCENLDLQNITESPHELKLFQVTKDILDRLMQATHPR